MFLRDEDGSEDRGHQLLLWGKVRHWKFTDTAPPTSSPVVA